MPSSPLAPPASPPARELVEFGLGLGEGKGGRRTLEWACAAARLADKEKGVSVNRPNRKKSSHGDDEDTEDDSEEAITPDSSFGADSQFGQRPRNAHTSIRKLGSLQLTREESKSKEAAEDEDVMRAALALCGLGRRSTLTQ
ncbi:hypothetical protein SERLA73DRAFT_189358 [Serpula lacrymans var. lacrymans S7.3]|uniref:Uncharacterized protein n=2 Tax=Serpula lacrymans var. lacrymans TaxID=341189 RepID=F8QDF8_SERL3|nr:hypothetical protein SERLA73DRAFT_189358 [Serpula lacrymans var. lacrymans S7.3]